MSEQTFPWRERDDYAISAWTNDLINVIKKRGFLMKKEDAWLVFQENMNEFLDCYVEGMNPVSAFEEYAEDEQEVKE